MIVFFLNDEKIRSELPPSTIVLDFLRRRKRLTGTREGCREGDCGACAVLVGRLAGDVVQYRAVNSCLLLLGDVHGAHLITIEGLNRSVPSPVQRAIVEHGATQCGFCTPGMIVSLTAFLLNARDCGDEEEAMAALDGNVCRCTGYAAILRAVRDICRNEPSIETDGDRTRSLIRSGILPECVSGMAGRLRKIREAGTVAEESGPGLRTVVAGGTDFLARERERPLEGPLVLLSRREGLKGVAVEGSHCRIGAATTVSELLESAVLRTVLPGIERALERFASTPVRNRATVGGNIVNASPAGDLTVLFLALGASVVLTARESRGLPLEDFFRGYKKLDLREDEIVSFLTFPVPSKTARFHFEKVSKRARVDIASASSAIQIEAGDDGVVASATLSAGGVGPVPLVLSRASEFLRGRRIHAETAREAGRIARSEISPIDDVRGSAEYKALLLDRLVRAHFSALFPDRIEGKDLA